MKARALHPALAAQLGPICVAVTGADAATLFARATEALGESRFVELRLDALAQPGEAMQELRQFCAEHATAAVLATCRRVAGGGNFKGTTSEQLALLVQCAQAGALLVDVELETLEAVPEKALEQLGAALGDAGTFLMVSTHDFTQAGEPEQMLARLQWASKAKHTALFKVVGTATCLADNLRMLNWLQQASATVPVVGMLMGEAGVPSRILGPSRGSAFTFASSRSGETTAAGQVSASILLHRYHLTELTTRTLLYGVAGNPVSHSLSPVLHNAAFGAEGRDAVYLPLHTTGIDDLMNFIQQLPIEGLSVTMPWKVEIVRHLAVLDENSRRIGAVNTVTRRADGCLLGSNTDAPAIVEPLQACTDLNGAKVLVLGAGGAARAAVVGLLDAGAEVFIWNRTAGRALRLAEECGATLADAASLAEAQILVHATPAGMVGCAQLEPGIDLSALLKVRIVFEMVYRPEETALTRWARARGCTVINGLDMFTGQAARQWATWTGHRSASETVAVAMRTALADTLARESQ